MFAGIQASSYGFSGIQRPTYDYVRAGDVIRVSVFLDAVFSVPPIGAFRSAIASNSHLRLISLDQSQLGTLITGYAGALLVTVQALNDFSKLDDVTRLVAGIAQGAGLSVLINSTRGEFVTQVEDTGGSVAPTLPGPGASSGASSGVSAGVSDFFSSLTSSPVTLAVIVGGAVLLLAAMKK